MRKSLMIAFFLFIYSIKEIDNSQIQSHSKNINNKCLFTLSDGNIADLSMLRRNTDYTFTVGRYIYKANFCGNQIDRCSGLEIPASIYIRCKTLKKIFKIKKNSF